MARLLIKVTDVIVCLIGSIVSLTKFFLYVQILCFGNTRSGGIQFL